MISKWFDTLGVFDLETTGVDIETSRIVSAHVGVIDATGTSIESTEWLADPGIDIPAQASAVHGITTERARAEGRRPAEVVAEIIATIRSIFDRGLALSIYNAPYDLSLLNREARRYGVAPLIFRSVPAALKTGESVTSSPEAAVIDPLIIDKAVDRYRKGKRTLEAAALHYGVDLTDAHDAGADAVAAGRLAQALARNYTSQLDIPAAELHQLQIGWCREQAAGFQEYMRRTKDPNFTTSGSWPER